MYLDKSIPKIRRGYPKLIWPASCSREEVIGMGCYFGTMFDGHNFLSSTILT
jgi:hypothetical protein